MGRVERQRNYKVYDGKFNDLLRGCLPMIRFEGKFLLDHGFKVGDEIEVLIQKERIFIKKIQPDGSPENQSQP